MAKKVERYAAPDGREFQSEEACLRYEAVEAMIATVPDLAIIRVKLEANMNQISTACEPLARFLMKTTLEDHPETTPDHPEGVVRDSEGSVIPVFTHEGAPTLEDFQRRVGVIRA